MWEQERKSGSKQHAEHVDEANTVRGGRLLRSRRRTPALTEGGWSDKRRTADKIEAGLAEQDAANWARNTSGLRGRLSAARVGGVGGDQVKAGKKERASGAICRARRSVIWRLALSERLGETLHANSPWREVVVADANS